MLTFIAGLVLFFAPHSVAILVPARRALWVRRLGAGPWKIGYSLLSALGLLLIVLGFGLARQHPQVLYVPPPWLRYGTFLLMLPVFPLLIATYLPGVIQRTVKHPMLTAVKCWASAHLLANGMLADVLLFGSFLLWAVLDRISLRSRPAAAVPALSGGRYNDLVAVLAGLLLYALVVWRLHALIIGVPVLGLAS
jgi:uncharacterized membrane protein